MLIENELRIGAPLDRVWQHLQDLPGLAPCLPGAELTGQNPDGSYAGTVSVRLGPVSLRFTGTARILESDPSAHRIVLLASGSEARGRGTAQMRVTTRLTAAGVGNTTMAVVQDLQVSGAAAQYGRGMIADVTSVLLGTFADCIGRTIEAGGSGAGTATAVRAAPASGLRIGLAAAALALKRVLRRFFGPSTRP
ncbi:MAG: SRPBCC family protein [Pseudonocardia sp.]